MPLSTTGIAHQIVSSLYTYRVQNLGTINDCKVVINHLIRKFSEPLAKEGLQKRYNSRLIKGGVNIVKEHVLPVKEIMHHLLEMDLNKSKVELASEVQQFLIDALVIVHISEEEDEMLNDNGFQRRMPIEYSDSGSIHHNDIWARYKCAGIYENVCFEIGT